jgi:hypothetical protein
MLASSSPTISAPPSPSTAFHTPARAYHASRRTSASSTAQSPRFVSASRRYDAPPSSRPVTIPSPTSAVAQSPQGRKRSRADSSTRYVDSGTQYTPPGYPPTFHPPGHSTTDTTTAPTSVPVIAPPTTNTPRGETSAVPVATEPSEPALRVDPQPVAPPQNAQPQTRRVSRESMRPDAKHEAAAKQPSAVLPGPSSPAKRARPEEPNVKVMPFQYETCDTKDLGVLISDMLMELVRLNDGQPLLDGALTRFHSRHVCVESDVHDLSDYSQSPARHICA